MITVRKVVQVSIPLDLTVQYDGFSREANIVSVAIPKHTSISARAVHESLTRGDYKSIDAAAREKMLENFVNHCNYFHNCSAEHLTKFRSSIPCNPLEWVHIMGKVYKHCSIPTSSIEKVASSLNVLIEPVHGPKYSLYFWPKLPGDTLSERESDFRKHIPSLNSPTMEFMEDNTIYVEWKH